MRKCKMINQKTMVWVAIVSSVVGSLVWGLHALLNYIIPPNETLLDLFLFGIATLCKIALIVSVPFLIKLVCEKLYHDKQMVIRCAFFLLLGLAILVTCLTLMHDRVAEVLNNEVVRFYYVSDESELSRFHYIDRAQWLPRWKSGQIVFLETAFGAIIVGLILSVGYFFGKNCLATPAVVCGFVIVVVGWHFCFGIALFDYDIFLGGLFSDSLLLDLIFPCFIIDPCSEISFIVVFLFVACSLLGILPRKSKAPAFSVHVMGVRS